LARLQYVKGDKVYVGRLLDAWGLIAACAADRERAVAVRPMATMSDGRFKTNLDLDTATNSEVSFADILLPCIVGEQVVVKGEVEQSDDSGRPTKLVFDPLHSGARFARSRVIGGVPVSAVAGEIAADAAAVLLAADIAERGDSNIRIREVYDRLRQAEEAMSAVQSGDTSAAERVAAAFQDAPGRLARISVEDRLATRIVFGLTEQPKRAFQPVGPGLWMGIRLREVLLRRRGLDAVARFDDAPFVRLSDVVVPQDAGPVVSHVLASPGLSDLFGERAVELLSKSPLSMMATDAIRAAMAELRERLPEEEHQKSEAVQTVGSVIWTGAAMLLTAWQHGWNHLAETDGKFEVKPLAAVVTALADIRAFERDGSADTDDDMAMNPHDDERKVSSAFFGAMRGFSPAFGGWQAIGTDPEFIRRLTPTIGGKVVAVVDAGLEFPGDPWEEADGQQDEDLGGGKPSAKPAPPPASARRRRPSMLHVVEALDGDTDTEKGD
jgi:hypothetical protein